MKQSFLFNLLLLISVNLLIKPLYIFGIDVPVQNAVGHEAYGMYFVFLNLGYILQMLSDLGLQNHTTVNLPMNQWNRSDLLTQAFTWRILLMFVYLFGMSIAGAMLGYWWMDSELFLLVMIYILGVSTFQFLRAIVAASGRFFIDTLLSSLDKLLLILILASILWTSSESTLDIYRFARIQITVMVICIIVGIACIGPYWRWSRPRWTSMRVHITEAIPFVVIISLMFLYTKLDALMIMAMMEDGSLESGLYASAYRIYDACAMLMYLFAGLLLPMFARIYPGSDEERTLFYGSLGVNTLIAVYVMMTFYMYRTEVMHWLYEESPSRAISAFGLLMWAFLFKSSTFITSTLLTARKHLRPMIILFIITIGINALLNYWWIGRGGIIGAARATAYTQCMVCIGLLWLCHSRALIPVQPLRYSMLLLPALIAAIVWWNYMPSIEEPGAFILPVILSGVGFVALYLIFHWRDLRQLLQEVQRP